jgi:NitT/TauT family transport system ATP-binding protein
MVEDVIRFEGVGQEFIRRGRFTAIQNLTFRIRRGEFVSIVGRTGCGKSTTVNILLGLLRPTRGAVDVLGYDPTRDAQALRGKIGCVFQSDRLLPWRTAIDNVRVPLEVSGRRGPDTRPVATHWLERVGLAGFEDAYPHELSGGMRQRVALARALVSQPEILIADEAFGHLDEVTGMALRREFKQIARQQGSTVLQITHSLEDAVTHSDRILVFGRPGRILADVAVPANAAQDEKADLLDFLRGRIEGADEAPVAA